jgi:hypothetical protein
MPVRLRCRAEAPRDRARQLQRRAVKLAGLGGQPGENTGTLLSGHLLIEEPPQYLGAVGGDHRPVDGQLLDLIEFQRPLLLGGMCQRRAEVTASR